MKCTSLKFIYVQDDRHQNTTERALASEVSVASLLINIMILPLKSSINIFMGTRKICIIEFVISSEYSMVYCRIAFTYCASRPCRHIS